MEPSDLLRYAAGVLENMRLRYFVTGSTATILYGEVRFTNDIDIVWAARTNTCALVATEITEITEMKNTEGTVYVSCNL